MPKEPLSGFRNLPRPSRHRLVNHVGLPESTPTRDYANLASAAVTSPQEARATRPGFVFASEFLWALGGSNARRSAMSTSRVGSTAIHACGICSTNVHARGPPSGQLGRQLVRQLLSDPLATALHILAHGSSDPSALHQQDRLRVVPALLRRTPERHRTVDTRRPWRSCGEPSEPPRFVSPLAVDAPYRLGPVPSPKGVPRRAPTRYLPREPIDLLTQIWGYVTKSELTAR